MDLVERIRIHLAKKKAKGTVDFMVKRDSTAHLLFEAWVELKKRQEPGPKT